MYWYITMDRASDIMILHNWPEITFDHTIIQGGHIIKSNFVNKSFFICSESKQNKMLLERTLGCCGIIRTVCEDFLYQTRVTAAML